jgi:hypothetical protein
MREREEFEKRREERKKLLEELNRSEIDHSENAIKKLSTIDTENINPIINENKPPEEEEKIFQNELKMNNDDQRRLLQFIEREREKNILEGKII